MAVRIIAGKKDNNTSKAACLYDSVTEWAFGPVMDSEEEATAFLDYLGYHSARDPRSYSDRELENKFAEFREYRLKERIREQTS